MINVIIYGSMMNYMKRKGTWECGSAVRNKQTNKQAKKQADKRPRPFSR